MSDAALTVAVNRGEANSLATETDALETEGSFSVALVGHDRPAHVHCRLGGAIEAIARLDETNHYVGPDAVTTVPVAVEEPVTEPIAGHLELVTGYGAETLRIDLSIKPPDGGVQVEETLSKPDRDRPARSSAAQSNGMSRPTLRWDPVVVGVLALAVIAVAIGLLTAATVGTLAALVGLVIVTVGVGVAAWVLVSG